jgi:thiol-disulfide isomerase/thioredoxin
MFHIQTYFTTSYFRPPILIFQTSVLQVLARKLPFRIFLILFCLSTTDAYPIEQNPDSVVYQEINLDPETELTLNIYPASGHYRVLWIPAYATPLRTVESVALQLNQLGIEVWYADLLEARFLPKTSSSVYKMKENDLISLFDKANEEQNKKLFIVAESRAAVPVLLALRAKQLSNDGLKNFGGVIMNSPYLFIETPDPGLPAQLMPVASATNLPIYIFQPKDSPRFWQLKQSISALEKSGSDVFVHVLTGIRGRFLFRPDSTPKEDAITEKFGQLIAQALKHLETINHKSRPPVKQSVPAIRDAGGKKDRTLQAYQGNPHPPSLILDNLSGQQVNLDKISNRIVLVNFWASWCPPCVDEMPSLQRLSKKLPEEDFTILGVNIAEDKATIQKFLSEQVNVDFPILLDSNGNTMRQWNVMAFPTSFVVDKNGKIRYALFGSIDWDTAEIIKTLQNLLNE